MPGRIAGQGRVASIPQNRWSSAYMAGWASIVLREPRCTELTLSLAASVLSQAATQQRQTSAEIAAKAGSVLNDPKSSQIARALAASVLSQRFPKRK